MPIVNFAVPEALDQRVEKIIKTKGFGSKAEFFRFAAIHFIDIVNKPIASEEERFDYLTRTLSEEIRERFRSKKLPSAKEQLADI
jgi:Arc/MetJ-type ribon-helix-helix transcriptional regulator